RCVSHSRRGSSERRVPGKCKSRFIFLEFDVASAVEGRHTKNEIEGGSLCRANSELPNLCAGRAFQEDRAGTGLIDSRTPHHGGSTESPFSCLPFRILFQPPA